MKGVIWCHWLCKHRKMNPSLIMILEQLDKRSLNGGVLNKAYVWTRKLGQLMSRLYRLSIKLPCQSLLEPFERPLGVYFNPFSRLFMYSCINSIYFLLDRSTHCSAELASLGRAFIKSKPNHTSGYI